jgi:outer membrane protein OmpA-like peptidoglycan-associated protein
MRKYPHTSITLVGCNAGARVPGETRVRSKRRAETVRRYLVDIWGIAAQRIAVRSRDLPEQPSTGGDTASDAENARVDVQTKDRELRRPIVQTELRRYPQPETMMFVVGAAPPRAVRRRVEIMRNGQAWHTLEIAPGSTRTALYNWGRGGVDVDLPIDESPYVARIVSTLDDGTVCVGDTMHVPVLIITNERKRRERMVDKTIDRYTLLLFPYASAAITPHERRIIEEYILASITDSSRVTVTGYASDGEKDATAVSEERARVVIEAVRPLRVEPRIEGRGVGDESPLYRNDLPEGRFYNRTVQVFIETPT